MDFLSSFCYLQHVALNFVLKKIVEIKVVLDSSIKIFKKYYKFS